MLPPSTYLAAIDLLPPADTALLNADLDLANASTLRPSPLRENFSDLTAAFDLIETSIYDIRI
jgi:hypothetical protein